MHSLHDNNLKCILSLIQAKTYAVECKMITYSDIFLVILFQFIFVEENLSERTYYNDARNCVRACIRKILVQEKRACATLILLLYIASFTHNKNGGFSMNGDTR